MQDANPRETPLLEVRDLHVHFPIRRRRHTGNQDRLLHAVDGVRFGIEKGTTLGLVGESGCGKTTLARALLRLIDITAGNVRFDGVDLFQATRPELRRVRRDMQLVFQDPYGSLNPRLTVEKIVAEPLEVHGIGDRHARRVRVANVLEQVGLHPCDAQRYPHSFSGGQRQRIVIARAIIMQPRLIICDEPVSALDVSIQSQILNLLNDLKRELGLTYLFIAHNLAVVQYISDRVAVMHSGKIVELADTNDLFVNPQHPYTKALLDAVPKLDTPSR